MDTSDLIDSLAQGAAPVRRLASPAWRALGFLALALPFMALVMILYPHPLEMSWSAMNLRFILEEAASLATGIAAAFAAFATLVPGRDRRIALLPLIPLAVWLAAVGRNCLDTWFTADVSGDLFTPDWGCMPPLLLLSTVPTLALLIMLRRGVPLMPRATLALGGLAVAGLVNVALRLLHAPDASFDVLAWHTLFLGAWAMVGALTGSRWLRWRAGE